MECNHCGEVIPGKWVNYWKDTREPAERIFKHAGNHPKLIKSNELIEEARMLEREVREEQNESRKSLKAEYKHSVHVKIEGNSKWSRDLDEGTEYIVIESNLVNKEIFEEHVKFYGSLLNPPKEHKSSVKYYRLHGLLLRAGGGHITLRDKQLCSDEEWESLKKGNIPEKFMR